MKLHIKENINVPEFPIFRKDSKDINWKYRQVENIGSELKKLYSPVNESNLSRLTSHINNACFMISACRGNADEKTNLANTDKLAKELKNAKLGFIRVLGGYVEDTPDGNGRNVEEYSFFVPMPKTYEPEDFFNTAIELCKKFNQDSVLISMPKFDIPEYEGFGYYNKNGELVFSPGSKISFADEDVKDYFSALIKGSKKGVKWSFKTEWLAVRTPDTHMQAVMMDSYRENLLSKYK